MDLKPKNFTLEENQAGLDLPFVFLDNKKIKNLGWNRSLQLYKV